MDRLTTPIAQSLINRDVGPYRIIEELGAGGMGRVYRAIDRSLERPVALKILFDLDDPENIDRFKREAKVLGKLGHPNTIQIYWVGEIEGYPCFAMEYIEGGVSVYDLLRQNGILPAEVAVDVVIQACKGLEAAREAGVVHRDIKPNNLLIAPDGTVKIADFGLAKLTQDANNELTQSGIIMGTPYYMSPEQGQGQRIDHRADQYSLGATLYHMLTGFTPFEAENPVSLIIKHVREPLPDLRRVSPSTPDALRRIIEKMMEKDANQRYDSYETLIEDLESYIAGQQPRHARTQPKIRFRPTQIPVWIYIAAGALLGIAITYGLTQLGSVPRAPSPTATLARLSPTPVDSEAPLPSVTPRRELGDLVAALQSDNDASRSAAAVQLGQRQDKTALVPLIRVLESDPSPSVRARAAWALGRLHDQQATPALLRAIDQDSPVLALAAIDAVTGLADIRAVEPLGRVAATHADPDVRLAAASARAKLFDVEDEGPEIGGHGRSWWLQEFRTLRARIDRASLRAAELDRAVQYYEERYGFTPETSADTLPSPDRKIFDSLYRAARNERTLIEREGKLATQALERLNTTANREGVPEDWRG